MFSKRAGWSLARLRRLGALAVGPLIIAGCSGMHSSLLPEPLETSSIPSDVAGSGVEQRALARPAVPVYGTRRQSRVPRSGRVLGTDQLTNTPRGRVSKGASVNGDGVTLNLVNVQIAEAAKTVLGDVLGLNYAVDERVTGNLTIQTSSPLSRTALTDVFETILVSKGATIVEDSGFYKVVPTSTVAGSLAPLRKGRSITARAKAGIRTQVVPLKHVSAAEMARVLKSIAPEGSILSIQPQRSIIILSGTNAQLDALLEAIDVFDVDVMGGKSFALIPLKSTDPEALTEELETVFENGQGGALENVVRFIPNRRLNAVLVISNRARYLQRAENWVRRLDRAAQGTARQLYVYNIQNRPAPELANVLQQVFSGHVQASTRTVGGTGDIAPRLVAARTTRSSQSIDQNGADTSASAGTSATLQRTIPPRQPSRSPDAGSGEAAIKIVADEANNSLLVMASPQNYRRVLKTLERIDVVPNQVLLEAVIAEVTLNDELRFGLKWFFENNKAAFSFTDAVTGAVAPTFPGFNFFFNGPDVKVSLDALAGITKVNVISSPTLMVLDNKTATLQVGDQVPVATQSSVSSTSSDAPIVSTVEFRDTGVILNVTPRVNDNGRVILDIEQEVSDVSLTTSSGIDSPTIQQRKIKTTVAVDDGTSLALGGLIQERDNLNKTQVPIAGDIPLLGNFFKKKNDTIRRTELVIFITPHVIYDPQEAHGITEEFRRRLNLDIRPHRRGPPDREENISRVIR